MSTLTKALIILLSLLSIFLCGVVVSYVGTANNYKSHFEEQQSLNDVLKAEVAQKTKEYNAKIAEMKTLEKDLRNTIQGLEDEKVQVATELRKCQRESLAYKQQSENWKGLITSFEQTISNMEQSRQLTQEQLDMVRSELVNNRKELNEITAALYEKIVDLDSLEAERKRFLEQKTALEKKLNQLTQATGEEVSYEDMAPVTREPGQVQPAADSSLMTAGALKGLVNEVGQSLITISLGSADGVEEGMVFHALRGEDFLADIVITDVDVNKSAGVLELVQERPRVGDTVSTEL